MTNVHKAVLEALAKAKESSESDPDYWQNDTRYALQAALFQYGKRYQPQNMNEIQNGIRFEVTELRDAAVVTAIVSWIEQNGTTKSIHLHQESCSKVFGNKY